MDDIYEIEDIVKELSKYSKQLVKSDDKEEIKYLELVIEANIACAKKILNEIGIK